MFILQEPGNEDLLEAINNAADNAENGGGIFAFASKAGIAAFLQTESINQLLDQGNEFKLIVGVDSITNAEAILYLSDQVEKFNGNLNVSVFYHDHPNSTFHPKFSWFCSENRISLVLGSGNLTLRGLGQASASTPPNECPSRAIFPSPSAFLTASTSSTIFSTVYCFTFSSTCDLPEPRSSIKINR